MRTGLMAAMTAGVLAAAGCSRGLSRAGEAEAPTRTVRAESFAANPALDRTVEPTPTGRGIGAEPDVRSPSARSDPGDPMRAFGQEPVVVRGMAPTAAGELGAPAPAPRPRGSVELIDAKVGDINGRPIFASTFFEPIESRLIAEAQRLNRNEWRRVAAEDIIRPQLDNLIADELLRAEALASLTPAQRQGLRSFLTGFRRDLVSENLGSEQLARQRLQDGTGRTLDDALRDKETDTLIRLALNRQINRRINVSWRDIRQRYERDQNIFNPPPVARFRLIRTPNDRPDDVTRIGERLNAGEAFDVVAQDTANTFERERGGLSESPVLGAFEQGEFFPAPALNERARALKPGETVGPFVLGNNTFWMRLDAVERTSISLYDAQLRINQELTLERRRREQQIYLARLQERARVSDRDEMLLRLLRIAEERYGPRG